MAEIIEPAPSTQATYSDSDLAPISELIKTAQQRGGLQILLIILLMLQWTYSELLQM